MEEQEDSTELRMPPLPSQLSRDAAAAVSAALEFENPLDVLQGKGAAKNLLEAEMGSGLGTPEPKPSGLKRTKKYSFDLVGLARLGFEHLRKCYTSRCIQQVRTL